MKLSTKFIIYFIIIGSEIDYLWSRPVLSERRQKRQVVQPTWLTGPDRKKVDSNVRITDQNLKEAAAIRDAIQKAINAGTFAINTDEPKGPKPKPKQTPKTKSGKPLPKKPKSTVRPSFPKFEMPDLSQFEFPEFDITQFELPSFDIPEFEMADLHPSNWNFDFIDEQQRTELLQEVHSLWKQFWVTSKKVFNLGS